MVTVRRPELAAGTELGRYRLDAPLGTGGIGWAATDLVLGRDVALEVVVTPNAQIQQQLHALARVRHRNVITIHDVVAIDGLDRLVLGRLALGLIVMDRFDGETMAAWLLRCRPSPRAIVRVIAAAAEGVMAAHAGGVVHGAVRPDTILVAGDGRVVVTGFGQSRNGLGVLTYMTPEQLAGTPIGPAADQFSLCATLWEALANAQPFVGVTREQVALAIRAGKPSAYKIPHGLRGPLRRGMAFAAVQRWPSIHDMIAAVRRGLDRRALFVLGGIAGTLLVALAVVAAVHALRPSASERAYKKMLEFTDETCACLDTRDPAGCARSVTDEMSRWAAETVSAADDDYASRPTDDEQQLAKRLTECMTKAMTAGNEPQP